MNPKLTTANRALREPALSISSLTLPSDRTTAPCLLPTAPRSTCIRPSSAWPLALHSTGPSLPPSRCPPKLRQPRHPMQPSLAHLSTLVSSQYLALCPSPHKQHGRWHHFPALPSSLGFAILSPRPPEYEFYETRDAVCFMSSPRTLNRVYLVHRSSVAIFDK